MEKKRYIQELLDKYMEGLTTETEESELYRFFCSTDIVPKEWEKYVVLFRGFKSRKAKPSRKTNGKQCIGIAASIAILIGIAYSLQTPDDSTYTASPTRRPAIAYGAQPNTQKNNDDANHNIPKGKREQIIMVHAPQRHVSNAQTTTQYTTEGNIEKDTFVEDETIQNPEFIIVDLAEVKMEINDVRSALIVMNSKFLNQE